MAWLTVEQAGDVSREIITDVCCHSRHSQWGNVVHCLFVKIPVSAPTPSPNPPYQSGLSYRNRLLDIINCTKRVSSFWLGVLVHGFWFFCFEACGQVEFHGRLHTVSDPLTSWQPQTESYWKELGRPQWPDFSCLYCSEGRWGRVLFRMCTGCLYCSLGGRCTHFG